MAQFIRPISDITLDNWTGTFADIDETSANDSDFGYSSDNTDGDYEFKLGSIADPNGSSNHIIRVRVSSSDGGVPNDTGGSTPQVDVALYQGTTLIEQLVTGLGIGAWQTLVYTVQAANADNITDYSDLRIRVTHTGGGGSPTNRRGVAVSWGEMELPDFVEPSGVDMQVNIGDSWKSVDAVKINISDVWKEVVAIKINIGGVWKDVL